MMHSNTNSNAETQRLLLKSLGLLGILGITAFAVFRNLMILPCIGDAWHLLHERASRTTKQLFARAFDVTIFQLMLVGVFSRIHIEMRNRPLYMVRNAVESGILLDIQDTRAGIR